MGSLFYLCESSPRFDKGILGLLTLARFGSKAAIENEGLLPDGRMTRLVLCYV